MKKYLSFVIILTLILISCKTTDIEEIADEPEQAQNIYFRNENFENYETGEIGMNHPLKTFIPETGTGGLNPTVFDAGASANIVTTIGHDGKNTKALQLVREQGTTSGGLTYQVKSVSEAFEAVANIYVYRTMMRNGGNAIEPSNTPMGNDPQGNGMNTASFGVCRLDFLYGKIVMQTDVPLSPFNFGGMEYYYLPFDREWFSFTYIVDIETSTVTVAINDEIVANRTYPDKKFTMRSLLVANPYWTFDCNNNIGGAESAIYFDETQVYTVGSQGMTVVSSDSASVTLLFNNPVKFEDIKKINVSNAHINDYIKNGKIVTLYFSEELKLSETYTINAADVCDIYGTAVTFTSTFTPTNVGKIKTGASTLTISCDDNMLWCTEADVLSLTTDGDTYRELTPSMMFESSANFYANLHAATVETNGLKWYNLPKYPTLSTVHVPKDWTGVNELSFKIYSEEPTGDIIYITVYSDDHTSPWKDAFIYPITIDFKGERQFNIPLEDFMPFNTPYGWDKIDGLFFHSKIFRMNPNPYTVVYFNDIKINYNTQYPITVTNTKVRTRDLDFHRMVPFYGDTLNHNYPETAVTGIVTPINYEAYYKTERALLGYYPKYSPGVASFDPSGKAYIKAGSMAHIQYLNDEGKWEVLNLEPVIDAYMKVNRLSPWVLSDSGNSEEMTIRFDTDGGVYLLINTLTTEGYKGYLMYSPDNMETWQIYPLTDGNFARMERIEGNNTYAMERPPLIIAHYGFTPVNATLIVPQKTGDGKLDLSKKVQYATNILSPGTIHSGDGNVMISSPNGDKVYIIYSVYDSYENVKDMIPPDHPALTMSYKAYSPPVMFESIKGIPTFVIEIDLVDMKISDPVFVGLGGADVDNHNWGNISIDSDGRLHAFLNGHANYLVYIVTVNPYDITSWTTPEYIGSHAMSYASTIIDKNDTITFISRDSARGYRFDVTMFRKEKDGEWNKKPIEIMNRYKPYYEVCQNRMTYNPVTDELFISYFSQSCNVQEFLDDYYADIYIFPDRDRHFMNCYTYIGGITQNRRYMLPVGLEKAQTPGLAYMTYATESGGDEGVMLISRDGGKSFALALTEDFCGNNR